MSFLDYCNITQLPSHDELFSLLDQAVTVLENEDKEIRPKNDDGVPGGLIQLMDDKTSIIVPDIHARPAFVKNIMEFEVPHEYIHSTSAQTVLHALEKNKLNVICAGDAFHTEKTLARWHKIQKEFDEGQCSGPSMCQEMTECLSAFCALLWLKINFPSNFHFIKGNHENVMNSCYDGDRPFGKYAEEGRMVKEFISEYYGDDILYLISMYESLLPLVCVLPKAIVTHAEPAIALTKNQLINVRQNHHHVYSLIWTSNGDVKENTAKKIINSVFENYSDEQKDEVMYFCGHRPVKSKYAFRQNQRIIQFHNPVEQNVAFVSSKNKFDPEKDIISVKNIWE